jgi:hypothetical protein
MLGFIDDEKQSLVAERPAHLVYHHEVERVDVSGFLRDWHTWCTNRKLRIAR